MTEGSQVIGLAGALSGLVLLTALWLGNTKDHALAEQARLAALSQPTPTPTPMPKGDGVPELFRVSVMKPLEGERASTPMVFGSPGVSFDYIIRRPKATLLRLDETASSVAKFQDSTGKSLLSASRREGLGPTWLGSSPQFSENRDAVVFSIVSSELPAPVADRVTIEGVIALRTGSKPTTVTLEEVSLDKGSKLTLGSIAVEVTDATDKNVWGDDKWMVTLKSREPLDSISKLEFLTVDGKAVASRQAMNTRMGMGQQITYETTFGLGEKLTVGTVRVSYFTQVDTLTFPISQSVGLGLGKSR